MTGREAFEQEMSRMVVSPYEETLAYEYLYAQDGMTLKSVCEATVGAERLPSEAMEERSGLLDPRGTDLYRAVERHIGGKLGTFGAAVNRTASWPQALADAERPTPVLYYRGDISLTGAVCISVVGSRKASREGLELAAHYARRLVELGACVVTGLAKGVDAAAATAALEAGSPVVGVIGTPVDERYPKENDFLFDVAESRGGLLLSQVPFYLYSRQPFQTKRHYFPERNELMAAVSRATVIVEAADTSGTLTQARACLHQGRPLFVTRRCYDDPSLAWPRRYAERPGVTVVDSPEDVFDIVTAR